MNLTMKLIIMYKIMYIYEHKISYKNIHTFYVN